MVKEMNFVCFSIERLKVRNRGVHGRIVQHFISGIVGFANALNVN
jgi:hypothetical protein